MRHLGKQKHNEFDKMAGAPADLNTQKVNTHVNILYVLTAINTLCIGITFALWIRMSNSFYQENVKQERLNSDHGSGLLKDTFNASDYHIIKRRSYRNDIRFLEPHQYEKATSDNCQNIIRICSLHFQGKSGIPGLKGEKGERGYTGVSGSPGSPGKQGRTGGQGEPGLPGFPGSKGEEGLPGLRGPAGPTGSKGDRGDSGLRGPKGEKGFQGLVGFPGIKGDEGSRGIRGQKGEPGETTLINEISRDLGLKGEKGEKGVRGLIGFTGYKGDKGTRGQKGELGYGIRGQEGPDGKKGATGQKGEKGDCNFDSSVRMENWKMGNENTRNDFQSGVPRQQSDRNTANTLINYRNVIYLALFEMVMTTTIVTRLFPGT